AVRRSRQPLSPHARRSSDRHHAVRAARRVGARCRPLRPPNLSLATAPRFRQRSRKDREDDMNIHANARRWACAIDFRAHLMLPELYRITGPHSMFVKSNTDPNMSEAAKQVVRERDAFIESRMSDTTERVKRMDAMGVDIQVLSSSLVQQCTYW